MQAKIKELMKAGHKQKQAVAMALSHKRKMAKGGLVESQKDADDGSSTEPGQPVYPIGDDEQGLSPNVMSAQELADGLQEARMSANNKDTPVMPKQKTVSEETVHEASHTPSGPLGNKPNMSEAVQAAINAKRAKRRFK